MAKKKRNKKYQGRGAGAPDKPIVRKYSADTTNSFQRWFQDNKQRILVRTGIAGVSALLAGIAYGLIILIF